MQYGYLGFGIKGFYSIGKYLTRYLSMLSKKAQHKFKVLKFWEKHGLLATVDAFGISKRTLFHWKQQYKSGNGKPSSLEERSKRPKNLRRPQCPMAIIDEIKRLRKAYPNLGKEKVYVLLQPFRYLSRKLSPKIDHAANIITSCSL